MDAELWAAASGHAHHAAAGAEARRRTRHRRHARYRLSPLGLRENRRASELQPVRHRHRPDELHLADGQQRGLARSGRKAAGLGTDAALQIHPRDHRRALADQRSLAVQRRGGPRYRRVHVLPVRLLSARSAVRHFRNALRSAVHQQLHPRRRLDVRHDAAGRRKDPHVLQKLPQDARRHAAAVEPQQNFRRPHQRRGRAYERRSDQSQLLRAHRPGQRRAARPAAQTIPICRTPISISKSAAQRAAIATPDTWCACKKCGKACGSCSRPSKTCRRAR